MRLAAFVSGDRVDLTSDLTLPHAGTVLRRLLACITLLFCVGLAPNSNAQGPASIFDQPSSSVALASAITTIDIQKALIWTGHYGGMVDGGFGRMTRTAISNWQLATNRQATGELQAGETEALVADGKRIRDRWGWRTFSDPQVGYAIGYSEVGLRPGKRTEHGGIEFESLVANSGLGVYVTPTANLDGLWEFLLAPKEGRSVDYKARTADWIVVAGRNNERGFYHRYERRPGGIVGFTLSLPFADNLSFLVVATANSLQVAPQIRPLMQTPPSAPVQPAPRGPEAPSATRRVPVTSGGDFTGRTDAISLRLGGAYQPLSAEELFRRVSSAVYVVRAATAVDNIQGSAVAISASELLTNCHIVRGALEISLSRLGQIIKAQTISADAEADRCVLRVDRTVDAWVSVRPYSDIKIGEKVYSIGAPRGLELTITQGIVSGKRTADGTRYVQTDASSSPGSSGGGVFDAFGNLVGITTFTRRDSQNLNFAIAAEEFVR